MRHGDAHRRFNMPKSQRRALFANLTNALLTHEQITITLPRAKELRMITYVGDVYYTVDLLVTRLSTTYKYVKLGSSTDYVYYEYNGTGVRCVQAYVGGSSSIDSASTYMYYK